MASSLPGMMKSVTVQWQYWVRLRERALRLWLAVMRVKYGFFPIGCAIPRNATLAPCRRPNRAWFVLISNRACVFGSAVNYSRAECACEARLRAAQHDAQSKHIAAAAASTRALLAPCDA